MPIYSQASHHKILFSFFLSSTIVNMIQEPSSLSSDRVWALHPVERSAVAPRAVRVVGVL